MGSPEVLCCFICPSEEGQNDSTLRLAVVRLPPSLESKAESGARGTMWLALLPLPLRGGREMPSEGPFQGRREGFHCSAPPFSFLLINSLASLISPDEMRPREHRPPARRLAL